MMQRLLIANRAEIACRIARTARRMGVTSIAVYSDADRGSRHTRECDEAFHLGPAPAAQSYLDMSRILSAARRANAQAVHPGYGFLSENARFAQACSDAGLIFVGPPAAAINAMGSKSAAKAAMAAAGVPVAPGYHGDDQSVDRLLDEVHRIGFPVIVKASAGGGGKGMQVIETSAQARTAIESARRLALAAFGDDRLLLERYFRNARHVEVQVFADSHGDVRTLFDRDCSVQRRHQKVVEEAPAPGLEAGTRAAMAEAARTVARSIGYIGAGTIEFLLDEGHAFHFMEMNTRLQVEHPVTEMITGVDLVEWQLRVARGERLADFAPALDPRGSSIEVRVYAEDPANEYLPSVGSLQLMSWPEQGSGLGIRVDAGVEHADAVTSHYDPMLGKIISWGESRDIAIDRLQRALAQTYIVGVRTNLVLLDSILRTNAFRDAQLSTRFIEDHIQHLPMTHGPATARDLALLALWYQLQIPGGISSAWSQQDGWRPGAACRSHWSLDRSEVVIEARSESDFHARIDEEDFEFCAPQVVDGQLHVQVQGCLVHALVFADGRQLHLFEGGRHVCAIQHLVEDSLEPHHENDEGSLTTPLPGTVVAVHVKAGEDVKRGAPLVTVEAMKMEHTLTAPHDGRVVRMTHAVGERVSEGAVLVELA